MKVHFLADKTARYRRHDGGVTSANYHRNRKRSYYVLHDVLLQFARHYRRPLVGRERQLIFRKLLSLLYRRQGTLAMKLRVVPLIPKFFPGVRALAAILRAKSAAGYRGDEAPSSLVEAAHD